MDPTIGAAIITVIGGALTALLLRRRRHPIRTPSPPQVRHLNDSIAAGFPQIRTVIVPENPGAQVKTAFLGAKVMPWYNDDFGGELATVVAELAANALVHGGASFCDLGIYRDVVLLTDNGAAFDPLVYVGPSSSDHPSVGLLLLRDFLANRASQTRYASVSFRSNGGKRRAAEPPWPTPPINELSFRFLSTEYPVDAATGRAVINARCSIGEIDILPHTLLHLLEIPLDRANILLDADRLGLWLDVSMVSYVAVVAHVIMQRLPETATLLIRGRGFSIRALSKAYGAAPGEYGGRLLFEAADYGT